MPETVENHLKNESSLYLQQHAGNPVNWYPWTSEAFEKAKKENKLVLVSIGYSSCHWCHVMEKETFTDTSAARIMNENFVCIKVDREERPDIDQIYMSAVQLMTGSGGWPLNCFTLPDGRPIYGGTYFPNNSWKDVLIKLRDFYRDNRVKAEEYASELTNGLSQSEVIKSSKENQLFSFSMVERSIANWKPYLDNVNGGPDRTPKFPLPGNYQFLLRYAMETQDPELLDHVKLTLNKMAFGGIYDQVAGGFSRYSTDSIWKVPHFEKMLYDNSQLITLYSSAYKATKDELYKQIALETIDFLEKEMSDGNGAYYSAIDADSEGEEGKFYVWKSDEIKNLNLPACGKSSPVAILSDYYNINETGYWEKNNYILFRNKSDEEIASKHNISVPELRKFIADARSEMYNVRSKRVPPVLDKKVITSWNAIHISALCNAYEAFGDEKIRVSAVKTAHHLLHNCVNEKGDLVHICGKKNKKASGFLDDYAFTISALINLYQITFDPEWLNRAKSFTETVFENYYDKKDGFFWYTSVADTGLIARKKETTDNVIPASNSELANSLYLLGTLFDEKKYSETAQGMLNSIEENIIRYPSSYSSWLNLMMNYTNDFNEIVIMGENADEERKKLSKQYLPFAVIAGSTKENNELPLLENRFNKDKTLIYICRNRTCKLPFTNTTEAMAAIRTDLRLP